MNTNIYSVFVTQHNLAVANAIKAMEQGNEQLALWDFSKAMEWWDLMKAFEKGASNIVITFMIEHPL